MAGISLPEIGSKNDFARAQPTHTVRAHKLLPRDNSTFTALERSVSLLTRAIVKPVRWKSLIERADQVVRQLTTPCSKAAFAIVLTEGFPAHAVVFFLALGGCSQPRPLDPCIVICYVLPD